MKKIINNEWIMNIKHYWREEKKLWPIHLSVEEIELFSGKKDRGWGWGLLHITA